MKNKPAVEWYKSAVEWLVSQLNKEGFAQVVTDEEIEQAKEMEQEQMMQYYEDGYNRVAKLIEDVANKMVNLKL